MSRKKPKSAAQLLREVAARDPEAHNAALGRGYGVGPTGDFTLSVGVYERALREAFVRGCEESLRPVLDLVRKARRISPSERAVVYVTDLERALGMDAPRPHKTGSNDA